MARRFIALTGHLFDAYLTLIAPILAIDHLTKLEEDHNSLRICEAVSAFLNIYIGPEWIISLYLCATNSASNVKKASSILGESRR